jgi:hypothetical protein
MTINLCGSVKKVILSFVAQKINHRKMNSTTFRVTYVVDIDGSIQKQIKITTMIGILILTGQNKIPIIFIIFICF